MRLSMLNYLKGQYSLLLQYRILEKLVTYIFVITLWSGKFLYRGKVHYRLLSFKLFDNWTRGVHLPSLLRSIQQVIIFNQA